MPSLKCPVGKIVRNGYKRSKYTRKSGVSVKGSKVRASCIKDVGKPGKGTPIVKLEKDVLKPYGYQPVSGHQSVEERHKSLKKAIKVMGPLPVYRRINYLTVLNKNNKNGKVFRSDKSWIHKHYEVKKTGKHTPVQ